MEHISNAPVVGSSANAAIQVELTGATVTEVTISPVWRAQAQHYDLQEALTEAANAALDARAAALRQAPQPTMPALTGDQLRSLVREREEQQ